VANGVRAGTLLLASTDLMEPTFRRSVIYVVEHNDGGTLGVVLNRPSETAVYNVLPQWTDAAPGLRLVAGRVVMVDLDADPESISAAVDGVRIFAGYSGWTTGQLEGEIDRDDWIVLAALIDSGSASRSTMTTRPATWRRPGVASGSAPMRSMPKHSAASRLTGPPTNIVFGFAAASVHCGNTL